MPAFSIVTTCRGRLDHLRQSLPRMLAQADAEVIVVDYDCPQGTADWVRENHPTARCVRARDPLGFSAAIARNLGAAQANASWLLFVDADTLLHEDFCKSVGPLLKSGFFFLSSRTSIENYGTFICEKASFRTVAGFDEQFRGWGGEDEDLYLRLRESGLAAATYPGELIDTIHHGNDLRGFSHYAEKLRAHRQHVLYIQAKIDLRRLGIAPDQALCEKLYQAAAAAVGNLSPDAPFGPQAHTLETATDLGFPNLEAFGLRLQRKTTYTLSAQPGLSADQIKRILTMISA